MPVVRKTGLMMEIPVRTATFKVTPKPCLVHRDTEDLRRKVSFLSEPTEERNQPTAPLGLTHVFNALWSSPSPTLCAAFAVLALARNTDPRGQGSKVKAAWRPLPTLFL